ncbi:MAG: DUF502 domain-containing protein [Planctomycetota bacterium]
MKLRVQGKVFLRGLILIVPLVLTVFLVVKALAMLDQAVRTAIDFSIVQPLAHFAPSAGDIASDMNNYGFGLAVAVVLIYAVGLLAGSWLLRWPLERVEAMVERVPLVKSLYSAIKDLLQFLGGTETRRGKPCVVDSEDGTYQLLGLITQDQPERFLPEGEERIAVYVPMSYQIGGYTVYVPPQKVQHIEGMTVEELLKLCMTAGIGKKQGTFLDTMVERERDENARDRADEGPA